MSEELTIGVDLGGTNLVAGIVDPELKILNRAQRSVKGLDTEGLIAALVEVVEEVAIGTGVELVDVAGVGLGVPGLIDRKAQKVVGAVHLPLAHIDLATVLRKRLLASVVIIDNDGNCAALAEARAGAGQGVGVAVFIGLGTGISSGIVLNGQLFRGSQGAAPEIGHMIVDVDGLPCHGNCPSRGCFETIASGTALVREAAQVVRDYPDTSFASAFKKLEPNGCTGSGITELAKMGDEAACKIVTKIGEGLGIGLVNVVKMFNPDLVIIGGGVSQAGELLIDPARAVLREKALPPGRDHVRVELANFGNDAGIIGAAILARDQERDL